MKTTRSESVPFVLESIAPTTSQENGDDCTGVLIMGTNAGQEMHISIGLDDVRKLNEMLTLLLEGLDLGTYDEDDEEDEDWG